MILTEVLNKALRDIVSFIVGGGYTVIKSQQVDAPRPSVPYGDVTINELTKVGYEEHWFENNITDDDMTEFIEVTRTARITLGFYKEGAIDNANLVHTALTRETVRQGFSSIGLGLGERTTVLNISEALDSSWEERATFDVFINFVGTDESVISSILSAEITGEITDTVITINIP